MRRLSLFFALAIALVVPSSAQSDLTLYASAGLSLPAFPANFRDFYQPGPHGGLGAGMPLTRRTVLSISLQYSRYTINGDALRDEFELEATTFDGGAYTALGITADLMYDVYPYAQSDLRLYGLIGAGLIYNDIDDLIVGDAGGTGTREGSSETVLGLNAGIGVSTPVSPKVALFAEPRYTFLFTDERLLFITDESRHVLHLRVGVALRP